MAAAATVLPRAGTRSLSRLLLLPLLLLLPQAGSVRPDSQVRALAPTQVPMDGEGAS